MRFRLALVKCLRQKIFYASALQRCAALLGGRVAGVVPALLLLPAACPVAACPVAAACCLPCCCCLLLLAIVFR
jgi:hypothetical protein